MSKVCQHGSLNRQCEICERDKRIAELEAALADIYVWAAKAKYLLANIAVEGDKRAEELCAQLNL